MNSYIKKYVPIADMLVETFGKDCEVVLHDLKDPQHSVVYVANNSVTGRQIGESFDMLVKEVMISPKLKESYVANYYFTSKNNKRIRSSSLLIKDENGKIQGAMCINIDTTTITEAVKALQYLLPEAEQDMITKDDLEQNHVQDIVCDLIDNIIGNADVSELNRADRIEKIRFMESRGIFLIKGAIDIVAQKMGINKVTVYSYLDEIRGKRK